MEVLTAYTAKVLFFSFGRTFLGDDDEGAPISLIQSNLLLSLSPFLLVLSNIHQETGVCKKPNFVAKVNVLFFAIFGAIGESRTLLSSIPLIKGEEEERISSREREEEKGMKGEKEEKGRRRKKRLARQKEGKSGSQLLLLLLLFLPPYISTLFFLFFRRQGETDL